VFEQFLESLQDTSIATAIREGESLFPWIESAHVLALTLVIGSIAIVDLRLIGLASRDRGVIQTTASVLPVTWTAFVVCSNHGRVDVCIKRNDVRSQLIFSSQDCIDCACRYQHGCLSPVPAQGGQMHGTLLP